MNEMLTYLENYRHLLWSFYADQTSDRVVVFGDAPFNEQSPMQDAESIAIQAEIHRLNLVIGTIKNQQNFKP